MATRNIAPRSNGEGTIGTAVKRWLGSFFNTVDIANGSNAGVNTLQRSTAYAANDVVQYSGLNAKYRLVCTTAGTSGSSAPDFTGKTVGSTVTDGTVTWTVREFATLDSESVGDTDTPVYVTGGKVTSIGSTLFSKIVTHLASATAASISSLNTSSLFYRMLSWALTASGVQYNFTNSSAWYICFGSLLGGLIIQGGLELQAVNETEIAFPISFTAGTNYTPLITADSNTHPSTILTVGREGVTKFKIYTTPTNASGSNLHWVAFGT